MGDGGAAAVHVGGQHLDDELDFQELEGAAHPHPHPHPLHGNHVANLSEDEDEDGLDDAAAHMAELEEAGLLLGAAGHRHQLQWVFHTRLHELPFRGTQRTSARNLRAARLCEWSGLLRRQARAGKRPAQHVRRDVTVGRRKEGGARDAIGTRSTGNQGSEGHKDGDKQPTDCSKSLQSGLASTGPLTIPARRF